VLRVMAHVQDERVPLVLDVGHHRNGHTHQRRSLVEAAANDEDIWFVGARPVLDPGNATQAATICKHHGVPLNGVKFHPAAFQSDQSGPASTADSTSGAGRRLVWLMGAFHANTS
jgi:hypothetical protein